MSANIKNLSLLPLLIVVLGLLPVCRAAAQGQVNLVVNGGFETGDLTGWTVSGGGGGIFVDDRSGSNIPPHSGDREAALGTAGALGYLYQTLATTPGTSYSLSFWLNSPDGRTPNEFQVSWNGTVLFDQTDLPAIGWTNLLFVVTAAGTSTTLQFGARNDPSYLALDEISVVAGAPATVDFNLQAGGGGYQLSFQTLANRPETIQARTNLTVGAWMDVTNFTGDGSIQQFSFPTTNLVEEYFRVMTQ